MQFWFCIAPFATCCSNQTVPNYRGIEFDMVVFFPGPFNYRTSCDDDDDDDYEQ